MWHMGAHQGRSLGTFHREPIRSSIFEPCFLSKPQTFPSRCFGAGFWRRSRSSLPCRFGSIFPSPLFPFGPLAAATAASLPVQIIGMIANINIPFPSGVSEYIRLASIAQLNLEIMQHGCVFGEADNAYYAKVRFCFWLPVHCGRPLRGLCHRANCLADARIGSE